MNFTIDPAYLCDVPVHAVHYRYANKETLTNDELVEVIKNPVSMTMFSTDDHPEFKQLREQLGELGYIRIERGWWNGDRVTKSFALNGKRFKLDEQFPSACAMARHLKYMK